MKKVFSAIAAGSALIACLSQQAWAADNIIRVMAPIPESSSGGWSDASTYSQWVSGATVCTWTPSSDSVSPNTQLTQTGACGAQETRTVTPLERNSKTGETRPSGDAHVESRVQSTQAQSRVVYGDIVSPINAVAIYTNQYYVGARTGQFGSTSTLADGTKPDLYFIMGANKDAWLGGIALYGQASYASAKVRIARYNNLDMLGANGNVVATYALSEGIGGGPDGNANRWVKDSSSGLTVRQMFTQWYANPALIKSFRIRY